MLCFVPLLLCGQARTHGAKTAGARSHDLPAGVRNLLLETANDLEDVELDCSHFVHEVYSQVGLDYDYEPSRSLYQGTKSFRRVFSPKAGDLIVWLGHVGMVVDPEENTFISVLSTGIKVSSYTSHYWHRKGRARFFRYTGHVPPPSDLRETSASTRGSTTRYPAESLTEP